MSIVRNPNRRPRRAWNPGVERLEPLVLLSAGFVVDSTADDGSFGTLRYAINQVNADTSDKDIFSHDVIDFDFLPGGGPQTIRLQSALPVITRAVELRGENEPGYSGKPLIQIDGSRAGSNSVDGLVFTAPGNRVTALVVSNFSGDGIDLLSNSNIIEQSYIGTDLSGTAAMGNAGVGVYVSGSFNQIIKDVISANGTGLEFYRGDDPSAPQTFNSATGNFIGTDVTGETKLGNTGDGVLIDESPENSIGQGFNGAAGRNVISGNGKNGVEISGVGDAFASGSVQNNAIGTDLKGAANLGNGGAGVYINTVGSVGGPGANDGNLIAFNAGPGVLLGPGVTVPGVGISGNSIFSNAGQGIVLSPGANKGQAAPVVTSAASSASGTIVQGTLQSTPGQQFRIELFANPAGTDQGETYLGFVNASTGPDGKATFTFTTATQVPSGQVITATATGPDGTSQFSGEVAPAPPRPVNVAGRVAIAFGGFRYDRLTHHFLVDVAVTNTSVSAIEGPISLVLNILVGATLLNQSGVTSSTSPPGLPYIGVNLGSGSSLAPGQTVVTTLVLADPTLLPIILSVQVWAGPGVL
jgi:hypothetical protein